MPLCNFVTFYEQFQPTVLSLLKILKEIRKDINEVILLASWKDVNIDGSLKQSARRSHNNFIK